MYRPNTRGLRKVVTYSALTLTLASSLGVAIAQTSGAATTSHASAPISHATHPFKGTRPVALTGATLKKASASALKAVPGATVFRASVGPKSTYIVMLRNAKKKFIIVTENHSFKVTSTKVSTGFPFHPGQG